MQPRPKTVRVRYPLERGRIVLRTDDDWHRNVEADAVGAGGRRHEFRLTLQRPFLYFKPVRIDGDETRWAVGRNYLLLAGGRRRVREIYPHFAEDSRCSVCELRRLDAGRLGSRHAYRVFTPPGYAENTLKRYPVLFMQDGQNLFFPDEAYTGQSWRVGETLGILESMNAIDKIVVVGVYPVDRERDYTQPGYATYGRFVVEQLKPAIDAEFRTLPGPQNAAVMGSSLGGVASFYLHWQWPDVFGRAACLSSTFGWRDDLRERVLREPKRRGKIYLDSGWPGDNYEATRDLRGLLLERGYREGRDLLYFAFPAAAHHERSWAMRSHLPFQFFFGDGASGS